MLSQVLDPGSYTFSLYSLPTAVAAGSILLLGLLVLAREARSPVSNAFLLVTLSVAIWLFCTSWVYSAQNEAVALWWAKTAYLGVPFIAPATYQFTVIFLGIYDRYLNIVRLAWLGSILFAFAALATDVLVHHVILYPWGYYGSYGWLGLPFIAFFSGLLTASLVHYLVHYRSEPVNRRRQRIRWLMLAFGIGSTGIVDFVATYGIPLYPFGYLSIVGFALLSARAIWTYHLVAITPAFAANEIINTMGDALLVLDRSGTVSVANKAACDLFDLETSIFVGSKVADAIPEGNFGRHLQTIAWQPDVRDHEMTFVLKGAREERVLSISTTVAHDMEGTLAAAVCVVRDVTGYKRVEAEVRHLNENLEALVAERTIALAHANEELQKEAVERQRAEAERAQLLISEQAARLQAEEGVRAREVLLSIVSHDLRNPLSALRGTTRLLQHIISSQDEQPDSRVSSGLARIENSANKMNLLINQLLDFARLQAGQPLDLYRQDIDLVELAYMVAANHRQYTDRHVIEVKADLPTVRGTWDPVRLERVLDNLVANAVKYSPAGGKVTISISREDGTGEGLSHGANFAGNGKASGSVVITVQDEGIGIPESDLPYVFDWFHRASNVSERFSGAGIGLATVRQAIEQHGGTITAQSLEGSGTLFTLRLPVSPPVGLAAAGGKGD